MWVILSSQWDSNNKLSQKKKPCLMLSGLCGDASQQNFLPRHGLIMETFTIWIISRGRAPSIARPGYCSAVRERFGCSDFWADEGLSVRTSPLLSLTIFSNSCWRGRGWLLVNTYVVVFCTLISTFCTLKKTKTKKNKGNVQFPILNTQKQKTCIKSVSAINIVFWN